MNSDNNRPEGGQCAVTNDLSNNTDLYTRSGNFTKTCLENIISSKITITNMHFENDNFHNGLFDNGCFVNTSFTNCNFTGANLSESSFYNCTFRFCSLQTACFNESHIENSRFYGSRFGDTDIAGSSLSNILFEDPSIFSLKFWEADIKAPCRYLHLDGKEYAMAQSPVTINGLSPDGMPIVFLDTHILTGTNALPLEQHSLCGLGVKNKRSPTINTFQSAFHMPANTKYCHRRKKYFMRGLAYIGMSTRPACSYSPEK